MVLSFSEYKFVFWYKKENPEPKAQGENFRGTT